MNVIELKQTIIQHNKIIYKFDIPDTVKKYFNEKYDFFIEYPKDIDLSSVPEAVLTVPFATNLMIISAVVPMTVKVKKLDKAFYDCIPNLNEGFKKLYPARDIKFSVEADEIIECLYNAENRYTQFFTGGVDATSALITNLDKKPELINIWGGDILLEDLNRYEKNVQYFKNVSKEYGLKFSTIRSSLRFMYNEPLFDKEVMYDLGNTWWAAISHNICMCSLLAPFAYFKKIKTHFIASSYSENQKLRPCCNYSFINDMLCFSRCRVKQVDAYLTRDDKIQNIKNYFDKYKKGFHLYVCHHPVDGDNCSSCEKCYRTITALIEKKLNPNYFGFNVNKRTLKNMHYFLRYNHVIPEYWKKMQDDFLQDKKFWLKIREMKWFLKIELNSPHIKHRIFARRVCKKILRILRLGK